MRFDGLRQHEIDPRTEGRVSNAVVYSNSNGMRIQTSDKKTEKDSIYRRNPHELYHVQTDIRPSAGR